MPRSSTRRTNWRITLQRAATIVGEYGTPPTLRQLFYRLVSEGSLPNTQGAYQTLSRRTAEARRAGNFPRLSDGTREINRPLSFRSADEALEWLQTVYRHDRWGGQEKQVWLVIEKDALSELAASSVRKYGVPVVALRGYGSQTIVDDVANRINADGRPCVVLYVGDYDPSGKDIQRDFIERLSVSVDFERLAVTPKQIEDMNLPTYPGKATDSRAKSFTASEGKLVQVEVDAIDGNVLSDIIENAVLSHMDRDVYESVLQAEENEIEALL